ncbi:PQQ-dependent sugar dehydrogenase [Streptomyces sp. A3M-1-3]|uniref:PQQ-dependent sugar dehydrogenase n=1 Tax=Streptomyces sp. A3M-1-3 TaxID=2962044 RepID=UPI0020B824AD|nr:PQQ-dependent sugar dehydrogenase [Streptomyces sp. A3M-1-3]MCP3820533.1 PQQ-dependent sugar dehydrogenase [Streptomyces sp. A3M-1-3]
MASLIATAALLACGVAQPAAAAPPPTAPAEDAAIGAATDGGSPADVSTFSGEWNGPWTISFLPDGRSALATERYTHRVVRLGLDGSKQQLGMVPNTLTDPVQLPGQGQGLSQGKGGLLGVAPSPTWDGTTDKRVFFMHTTASDTRVARMSYDGTSLSDYTTVLGGIQRGGDHNGGKLAFGPDGYLYVSTGDARQPKLAQDMQSLNGKILRITETGAAAPGNPFGDRVYSYGHRNPQGLAWDRNGRLWAAEIGEDTWDELNLIKPGANYGWPTCEGACNVAGMTNPMMTWTPAEGVPSQLAIVRNVIYVSTLRGQRLWRVPIDGNSERVGSATPFFNRTYGRLRPIAKVPGADELWLGTNGRGTDKDQILKVTIK